MTRITNVRSAFEDDPAGDTGINRRSLLKGAAGGIAGAALLKNGESVMAQATPEASPAASPEAGEFFFPSGVEGVPDAYLHPPDPFQSVADVPGEGGTVRAFILTYNPPPPPRDENQYWQELEKRLGVTWEPLLTPQPDYGARSATLIASGDIPDLFVITPGENAAQQYQAMAQGAFLDLTPYVTGDALQDYPNLAALPQYMWDNVRFQGKIFGVPKPSTRHGDIPFYRADWAENLGLEVPASAEDSMAMLLAFTRDDPDGNGDADTWGMGQYNGGWRAWDNRLASQSFGAPETWRVNEDGSFEFTAETEEFREALQFLHQLYEEGGYHPDTAGMTFANAQNNFIAGETGLHAEGLPSFFGVDGVEYKAQQINPEARVAPLLPIGPGGRPGIVHNDPGFFGFTGIPSSVSDENRIRELLRILDYLVAPFGSEERIFLSNGIEGVHHEVQDNNVRITNDLFSTESGGLTAVMYQPGVFYYPRNPEFALEVQDIAKQVLDLGFDDPTWTLYSETNVSQGPTLDQFGQDAISSIVAGREPFDSLDSVIDEWRSRGGDQIRQEYEEALAQ